MPKVLAVFAQALDNHSDDHVFMEGRHLPSRAAAERQQASNLISTVTSEGDKVFESEGVEVFCSGPLCVIEIVSEELDAAGRLAPISVCIDLAGADQIADVVRQLTEIAHSIDRTISSAYLDVVSQALTEEQKKKRPMGCLFPFL